MRTFLICLSLLLLQGCSAIKLGYQQLPTLSYWWLDSIISFNSEQSSRAKEALEQLHQWHRREELTGNADFLQRSAQWSQGTVESTQVCSAFTEVQTRLDRLMREAVRQAAPVTMMLGPRQLSHMARQWESKNEEWEKDWLRGDEQARMERRMERVVNRYKDFYGGLNAEQNALIKAQLAQSPWTAEWGRQDRQRRQKDLLATLQRGVTRPDARGTGRERVVERVATLAQATRRCRSGLDASHVSAGLQQPDPAAQHHQS
jgi:hypothetical protein